MGRVKGKGTLEEGRREGLLSRKRWKGEGQREGCNGGVSRKEVQ